MTLNEMYFLQRYVKPLEEEIKRLTKENEKLKSSLMAYEELIKDLIEILKKET